MESEEPRAEKARMFVTGKWSERVPSAIWPRIDDAFRRAMVVEPDRVDKPTEAA